MTYKIEYYRQLPAAPATVAAVMSNRNGSHIILPAETVSKGPQAKFGRRQNLLWQLMAVLPRLPRTYAQVKAHARDMGVRGNLSYMCQPMLIWCIAASMFPTTIYHNYLATHHTKPDDKLVDLGVVVAASFSVWAAGFFIPAYRARVQRIRLEDTILQGNLTHWHELEKRRSTDDSVSVKNLRKIAAGKRAGSIMPWHPQKTKART
jgi:hypothetical protein